MTDGDAQSTEGAGVAGAPRTTQERQVYLTPELGCGLALLVLLTLAGTFVLFLPRLEPSNIRTTELDAATIRHAMILFRAENPDAACPSMEDIVEGHYVDPSMRLADAWDQPFRTSCDGRDVFAVSAGPDGKVGSADDIGATRTRILTTRSAPSADSWVSPSRLRPESSPPAPRDEGGALARGQQKDPRW